VLPNLKLSTQVWS